jgi:hypothetical protein
VADGWKDAALSVLSGFSWIEVAGPRQQAVWSPPAKGKVVNRNALRFPAVPGVPQQFTAWSAPAGGKRGFPGSLTVNERFVPGDTLEIAPGDLSVEF